MHMDLREFIKILEDNGELLRVKEETHWQEEIGAVSRRLCDLESEGQPQPALLFENITDYPGGTFFCNSLSSYRRYSLALGFPKDTTPLELVRLVHERLRTPHPVKPVVVDKSAAPCKENIYTGDEVDLVKMFPTPHWHTHDGGRYLGTFHAMIQQDLEDPDWTNWGTYRMMIHDKNRMGAMMTPVQHSGMIYQKYKAAGKIMPVCVAMGGDIVNPIVSCAGFNEGVSEVDMAGALRGKPIELVKAETCDLMVPADAEIILEGYVDPNGEMLVEGPFGEFTGYYGGDPRPREIFHVTCVTTRNNPILIGSQEGPPLTDDNICGSVICSALARQVLLDVMKVPGAQEVFFHPFGASWGFCVVSCKRVQANLPQQCAHAIWSSKLANDSGRAGVFIVVEEDVDPSNIQMVLWSMVTRCDPGERIYIYKARGGVNPLWPNIPKYARTIEQKAAGAILIDAGFPHDWYVAHPENVPAMCDWGGFSEGVRDRALQILINNAKHGR